jgi:hypothetical protein
VNEYALICDPGKRRDSATFMVMKNSVIIVDGNELLRQPDRTRNYLDIVFLDKFLRKPYPQLCRDMASLMRTTELSNNTDLLLDGNGVGEAVIDILREGGLSPMPIMAVGGEKVTMVQEEFGKVFSSPGNTQLNRLKVTKEIHVPKTDLVAAGMSCVQQKRVRVAAGIPWGEELEKQLIHFKPPNKAAGRKSFEADEASVHDDFVTDFLIGCWWFTRDRKDVIVPTKPLRRERAADRDWDPRDF